jgi:hypothetical protein
MAWVVVLECVTTPGREVSRDVDHELAHGQEREEDVVVEREIAFEDLAAGDTGTDGAEMIEVPPKLGQPLDEVRHRARAASFSRRIRRRKGSRSAARS